ncbi:MAG TPA: aspartate racemase [Clostridiales bacterium]|nr:aspartate racemase [Clostridiales bacterium]
MKVIGLIGGVTWVSTVDYYRHINRLVAERLGGLHSARLALWSLDFAEMAEAQHAGDWGKVGDLIIAGARALDAAGAEVFVICANTLHLVYDRVVGETGLPFVHIVDAVGRAALEQEFGTVGLLGTRFTMEHPFYRERLEKEFGLRVLVPDRGDRAEVHRIIYEELSQEKVLPSSRAAVRRIIEALAACGARAVILGCTELPHLFSGGPGSEPVPLLDPLILHCREAVRLALGADGSGR